jgi:hypothetical protein
MTLEQLAEKSGISVRAISNLERGISTAPHPHTLSALARGVGLAPDQAATLTARPKRPDGTHALLAGGCELPRPVPHFGGRASALALIDRIAQERGTGPAPVVAISGPAGCGKTALALRFAELSAHRFTAGCHYVDLQGTQTAPLTASDAAARLLRALGTPPQHIAADAEERTGQLRAVLAGRSCLVILDNAASEAQLRSLLPGLGPGPGGAAGSRAGLGGAAGSRGGMVLITSRRHLAGLDCVQRIHLPTLSARESTELLGAITGAPSDPGAAAVARLCGYLPLALRIAANRLASRPGWTMADLAARLSDPARRLDTLTAGDLGVRAAFRLSYAQLSEPARLVFRRLALVPGSRFTAELAAIAAAVPVADAENRLDELIDLNLVQPAGAPGRYQFHELMRLFATECLHEEESPSDILLASRRTTRSLSRTAPVATRFTTTSSARRLHVVRRSDATVSEDRRLAPFASTLQHRLTRAG